MLRSVTTLAAVGVLMSVSASAVELITYPTLSRGTLTFAPVPFAELDFDWLGAFAPEDGAQPQPTSFQLAEFLSGTPEGGTSIARPAGFSRGPGSPEADQHALHKLAPLDY